MGRKTKYIAVCLSFLMLAPFSTDTFAKGPKKSHPGGKELTLRAKKFPRRCRVCSDESDQQHGRGFSPQRERYADIRG
jgi:hypothetical protein